MEAVDTRDTEKHGRRYDDSVKELAFQLWEMRCQKSAAKVSRLLATEEFGGHDVSAKTITRWAAEHNWEDEATRRFEDAFPGMLHTLFRGVVYAAIEGQEYWQDVNAGRAEPDKVRLEAIRAAHDRIGFSPVGNRNPTDSIASPASQSHQLPSFSSMTTDELRAYEQSLRSRTRG